MNFLEAVKAIKNGKRIKRKHFVQNFIIGQDVQGNEIILTDKDFITPELFLEDLMANDWEETL